MTRAASMRLRVDERTLETCLDRLDRQTQPRAGLELRRAPRYAYRARPLTVELATGEATTVCCAAAARNLSRDGIGLLVGQFIWPGTECRLALRSLWENETTLGGRVRRCRYIPGTGVLYEIGVRFDRPVNVALFVPRRRPLRILLVDESPQRQELVRGFLDGLQVELIGATTAPRAGWGPPQGEFDLILLDLDSPSFDAFLVTKELRSAGYLGPIVGLACQTGRTLSARCEAAGCTGYLSKPLTREALRELLASLDGEPLHSTLAGDVQLAPLVNRFVRELRTLARQLSVAFEIGDHETLRNLAQRLQADGGAYGFDPISDEARHVQVLLDLEAPPARLRRSVYELIHVCLTAQPATWDEEERDADGRGNMPFPQEDST